MSIWPFRRKSVIDPDTATWHTDNFIWLIRQFGGRDALMKSPLVLPKPGFFRSDGEEGHTLALRLFEQVKAYCDMADWEVDLVPDDNPLAEPGELAEGMVAPQKHAAGTFGVNGNRIEITYTIAQLRRPDRLIATFAHELAHYLLATGADPPPSENEELEFLTDLAAVYLGFGVFLANTRFEFEGSMQGWRWQRAGYLPEADIVFALALFLRAKGLEPGEACRSLKPHLATMLKRAFKELSDESTHVVRIRSAMADGGAG